jgi:hypothetical protein
LIINIFSASLHGCRQLKLTKSLMIVMVESNQSASCSQQPLRRLQVSVLNSSQRLASAHATPHVFSPLSQLPRKTPRHLPASRCCASRRRQDGVLLSKVNLGQQ